MKEDITKELRILEDRLRDKKIELRDVEVFSKSREIKKEIVFYEGQIKTIKTLSKLLEM